MDQARSELTKGVLLRMNYRTDEDGRQLFQSLGAILKKSKGGTPVEMAIHDPAGRVARFKLSSEYFVDHMQIPVEQLEMVLRWGEGVSLSEASQRVSGFCAFFAAPAMPRGASWSGSTVSAVQS